MYILTQFSVKITLPLVHMQILPNVLFVVTSKTFSNDSNSQVSMFIIGVNPDLDNLREGIELPASKIKSSQYSPDLMKKGYKDHEAPVISSAIIQSQCNQRERWEKKKSSESYKRSKTYVLS